MTGDRSKGLQYVAMGNFGAGILGAIFWFMFASLLPVGMYGQLNYYLAIASLLSALSLFGLNTTVITYLSKGSLRIVKQAASLALISTISVSILAAILLSYVHISFLIIGVTFFAMSLAEMLGNRNYSNYSFTFVSERVLQILIPLILYYLIGFDGILIGYAIAVFIMSYRYLRNLRHIELHFEEIRSRIRFVLHSYSLGIAQSLTINLDKLIIAPVFGFATLGYYQLAFQFFMFLAIIPATFFQYLLPEESRGMPSRNLSTLALISSATAALLFVYFSPAIITTFFPNFLESITATQIMSFGIMPMTLTSIMNSRLLGREQTKPVFIGAIVYVSTQALLIFLLGTILGLVGLAFSVLIALTTQAAAVWLMSRRSPRVDTC